MENYIDLKTPEVEPEATKDVELGHPEWRVVGGGVWEHIPTGQRCSW